ncbi:MAG: hypothetical protein K8S98_02005 [Planctomycetes bacterium]|nr:hypothetical protein [Planctomycetota bacterium]
MISVSRSLGVATVRTRGFVIVELVAGSELPDPCAQDRPQRRAHRPHVLRVAERHETPILLEPLEPSARIRDRRLLRRARPCLRAGVQDPLRLASLASAAPQGNVGQARRKSLIQQS